jgi:electron-transferring-flavoprotein dehydrogenase
MSAEEQGRESMPVDVVIVGAGPAGLAAAIRLKQLNEALEVVVLEKGSEVGAHILSGAVIDPRALDELLPVWRQTCSLAEVPVTENHHWVLTRSGKWAMPHALMPPLMSNKGTYTGSLGNLCRWLAERAEALGVQVFPGFPAAEVLFDESGAVMGVATQDMGVAADGSHKPDYQPGMELHAKYTLFAEGARGHLTKRMKAHFALDSECQPQVYGLGIKELWDIPSEKHQPGRVIHTQGWPLSESESWGGGFLYHQANGQVALGFVTALDYANPYVHPFEEFQRWKQHPAIRAVIEGGKRVAYGARAINEGGWQSVPKLAFPGGALIGCAAGFVNVPRIKGTHTAMKSGMLAAEAVAAVVASGREKAELTEYDSAVRSSWIADELQLVKNAQPLVAKFGGALGTLFAGAVLWLRTLSLRLPLTL